MIKIVCFCFVTFFSFIVTGSLPESGCTSIYVKGLHVGHTTVTAIYTYADVTLRASVVIAAYVPVHVSVFFFDAEITLPKSCNEIKQFPVAEN